MAASKPSETAAPSYWVQIFTVDTWREFLQAGASVTGFPDSRWPWVQKLRPGDYLLCYLTRVSSWVGLLEVTSQPYLDDSTRIWKENLYPCRVDVRLLHSLSVEKAVPIRTLADRLSIFKWSNWSLWVMASPRRWTEADGKAVIQAIRHSNGL